MRYAIFDTATGRIDRIIVAPVGVASATASCRPGEDFVSAIDRETDATHYVEPTTMALVPFPPKPDPCCYWSWADKSWHTDFPKAKATRWADMKAARKAAIETPLVTPYGTFDADPESADNIIRTAHLMQTEAQTLAPGQQPTVDFTLADNSVVTLSAGEMVEVALLLAAQIQTAYARGREVRSAIDAATTDAQLQAITWEVA